MHNSSQSTKPLENRALSTVPKPTRPAQRVGRVGEGRQKISLHSPSSAPKGVWTTHIEGRYRAIGVHSLAMAWWCFHAGHITKRQLRVWFAAQEMLERRRYTAKPEHSREAPHTPRTPSYGLDELKSLVGGKGSKTADAGLSADLKRLDTLGLVSITESSITFAVSIDQLAIDDINSFWTMFNQLPHPRRRVPVPRRMLRALAGGFTSGMTAVVLATLIRSLFWHKHGPSGSSEDSSKGNGGSDATEEGAYRIDGRTKREWIAETFGVTPRTVTDARARLIELGWLIPLDTHQLLLNRYGTHDQINTDWDPSATSQTAPSDECSGGVDEGVKTEETTQNRSCGSSTPSTDFSGESSSLINRSPSSSTKKNQNTRRPAPTRAGPAGADLRSALKKESKSGSRKKKWLSKPRASGQPNIRDIRSRDLGDIGRLLDLHRQAVKLGLSTASEAGQLDFMAFAQRARMSGKRAGGGGALFFWLLREQKTQFITHATEEEARRMINEHFYGNQARQREGEQWGRQRSFSSQPTEYTKDEQTVLACIRVAKKHRISDPFKLACEQGWTRDRWEKAHESYESKQFAQLQHARGVEYEA